MCLCHPNTLLKDEVWVMRGIQVPFVVEPHETFDAGCADKYPFLSNSCLNSTIGGEFGENEKPMERTIIMI